jgi:hypothetical protein
MVVDGRYEQVTPLERATVREQRVGILPHAMAISTERGNDQGGCRGIQAGDNDPLSVEGIRVARMARTGDRGWNVGTYAPADTAGLGRARRTS